VQIIGRILYKKHLAILKKKKK